MAINVSTKLKQLSEKTNAYQRALDATAVPKQAAVDYAHKMLGELETAADERKGALLSIINETVAAADTADAALVFGQYLHAHVRNVDVVAGNGTLLLELFGTRKSPLGPVLRDQPGARAALLAALCAQAGRIPAGIMRFPESLDVLHATLLDAIAETIAPERHAEHVERFDKIEAAKQRASDVIAKLSDANDDGRAAA